MARKSGWGVEGTDSWATGFARRIKRSVSSGAHQWARLYVPQSESSTLRNTKSATTTPTFTPPGLIWGVAESGA